MPIKDYTKITFILADKKMRIILILISYFLFTISCKSSKETGKPLLTQSFITIQDCYYQNNNVDLGIGLLLWNGDCDNSIGFFKDKELSQEIYQLDFCNKINEICPLFFKPDYGIMYFSVKSRKQNSYEVYINDLDTLHLKNNDQFAFVSWKDFLMNHVTGIREFNGTEVYKVLNINGDLITIKSESSGEKKQIRWKINNKLAIELMLLI